MPDSARLQVPDRGYAYLSPSPPSLSTSAIKLRHSIENAYHFKPPERKEHPTPYMTEQCSGPILMLGPETVSTPQPSANTANSPTLTDEQYKRSKAGQLRHSKKRSLKKRNSKSKDYLKHTLVRGFSDEDDEIILKTADLSVETAVVPVELDDEDESQ